MENRILRLNDVKHLTGLSRSTIYAEMARGNFPRQCKLGVRSVGWHEAAVRQWMESRQQV